MNNRYTVSLLLVSIITCCAHSQTINTGAPSKSEDKVCGAKCLYVIMRGYGCAPSKHTLVVEELGPAPSEGYSLLQLRDVARKHNLYAENVALSKTDLKRYSASCSILLHLVGTNRDGRRKMPDGTGHYVICEGISPTSATIFDASTGAASEISHEIFERWSGNTLLVSKQPIVLELDANPRSWFRYVALALAISSISFVLCLLLRRSRWLVGMCIIVSGIQVGCSNNDISSSSSNNSPSTKGAAGSMPPAASGVWVDKPICDAGIIRVRSQPFVCAVKIYNSETQPVTIKDASFTCSCLYAKFSNLTIPAKDSIVCDLLLDSSKIGRRQAKAILLTNRNECISIEAIWNVVASLKLEPETLNGAEVRCGESVSTTAHVKQLEKLNLDDVSIRTVLDKDSDMRYFNASATRQGELVTATFAATRDAPAGLVHGNFLFSLTPGGDVEATLPFTVYIANDIEIAPAKLHFTRATDIYQAQVILMTEDVKGLDPMRLQFVGRSRVDCKFKSTDQEGLRTINIEVEPADIMDIDHVEISLSDGKFSKQIPVFFP